MSTMRERFNALVVRPYENNTSDRFTEESVEVYIAAISGALPTDPMEEAITSVISERVWTAYQTLVGSGMNGSLQTFVRPWVAHEVDLVTCPLLVGDKVEALLTRPHNASVVAGEKVTVFGHNGNTVTITGEDEFTWYVNRPQVRFIVPDEFPPLSTDLLTQISGTAVADRYRRLIEWAENIDWIGWVGVDDAATVLTSNDRWGGVDWCDTEDGKDYLGRVLKYVRERITRDTVTPDPMPERVFTPPLTTTDVSREEIERLNNRIATLERELTTEREQHTRLRSNVATDFEVIGEELGNKADERGLCSEYDEAISRVNRRMVSGFEIPARNVEVTFTVSGQITVPFTVEFTIDVGRNEDNEEAARNFFDNNYSASQILRNEYYDRYSAEIEEDTVEVEER